MDLRDSPQRVFWDKIEKIRIMLDCSVDVFSEWLATTPKEYVRLQRLIRIPKAQQVFSLINQLHIPFESLFDESEIDFKTICAHSQKNFNVLPDKYLKSKNSKKRTSINILQYLESLGGDLNLVLLLRELQVHPLAFDNYEDSISIEFLEDLTSLLSRRGFGVRDFFEMGLYSYHSNKSSRLGLELRKSKNTRDLIDRLIANHVTSYDQNFLYELIRLDRDSAIVRAKPSEKTQSELGRVEIGNQMICAAKSGAFASLSAYVGMPFSKVKKTACIHDGDHYCELQIDFPKSGSNSLRVVSADQFI